MISMTVEHPKRCDGKPREELFVEDRLHYSPAGYQVRVRMTGGVLGEPDKTPDLGLARRSGSSGAPGAGGSLPEGVAFRRVRFRQNLYVTAVGVPGKALARLRIMTGPQPRSSQERDATYR